MNADQGIKKFFKPTKRLNSYSYTKSPVKTLDLHKNHVEKISHETSSGHQTKDYNRTNRQRIVFTVNIIIDKRIYAKYYKGAYTLYSKNKGSCYFLIEPLIDKQIINIHTNFTRTSKHTTTFLSDKKSPSLKFVINQCWQIIYNIQDRIPARIKNKYWNQITTLWNQQFMAINNRLINNYSSKNQNTQRHFLNSRMPKIFFILAGGTIVIFAIELLLLLKKII
jgi:hypothetical protein